MNNHVATLKRLARDAELELIEKANGHFIVIGGSVVVHYWPMSKRLTAYVEGASQGRQYQTPKQVIALANT
jgi:hypothetical protein